MVNNSNTVIRLCLPGGWRYLAGRLQAAGAYLELRYFGYGVQGAWRKLVSGFFARPVIGDEHRIFPDGFHDIGRELRLPSPRNHLYDLPLADAILCCPLRVYFQQWLVTLAHQLANAPALRAAQVLRHYPAGGKHHGVRVVRYLSRLAVRHLVKMRFPVGR